jgi:hypothetical protein
MAWRPAVEPDLTLVRNGDVLRQRRHREREKAGKLALTVEVDAGQVIELLIESGLLDRRAAVHDRADIAAGITRFLELIRHA